MRAVAIAALLCGVGSATTGTARAHGRFPEAYQVAFHPEDPDALLVSTTFGLVVTRDGGATFRWVCRDALGVALTEDPFNFLSPAGTVFATSFRGLRRGDLGGCSWQVPVPELERIVIIDGTFAPDDPGRFYALTSSGGITNYLSVTDDDGVSWAPTGEPIDRVLFERVRIAPSDPARIYLSGATPRTAEEARRAFVHVSEDTGATWTRHELPLRENDHNLYLLAVDPEDPDVVYARVVHDVAVDSAFDRLIRSDDGGETWTDLFEVHTLTSLVFAPGGDGAFFVGARNPGTAAAFMDGGVPAPRAHGLWRGQGDTLEVVRDDLSIGCLAVQRGALYACGSNFDDGFALGRSDDGGLSFEPVLRFSELEGPVECGPESDVPMTCARADEDNLRDLGLVDAGPDGGVADGGGEGGGGGGCSCQGGGGASGGWLMVALLWRRRGR